MVKRGRHLMVWAASKRRPPDVSPIEIFWNRIAERLVRHPSPANMVDDVWYRLKLVWNELYVSILQAQFDFPSNRVKTVLLSEMAAVSTNFASLSSIVSKVILSKRLFHNSVALRKGPLTAKNLQLMVEEDNASNVQASTSVLRVAEALNLTLSTVQKIMRNILRYYPHKLQLVQELLPHNFETRHLFSLQFLARLEVDPE
ncbi:uncharacterized protein TNCV_1680291 [Trichonephila clavipes]|nr:uncharacterized protein TNCV_1680291 [Trichonephila clavipes]